MAGLSFDDRGLLAPGDYEMTFGDLRESLLVVGPGEQVEALLGCQVEGLPGGSGGDSRRPAQGRGYR